MLVENPNEKKATKSHRTLSTQKSKSGYNEEEGLVEWEAEVNKKELPWFVKLCFKISDRLISALLGVCYLLLLEWLMPQTVIFETVRNPSHNWGKTLLVWGGILVIVLIWHNVYVKIEAKLIQTYYRYKNIQ